VVSEYTVEGVPDRSAQYQVLSRGTTIGYRKLDRFPATRVRGLRLTVRTVAPLSQPLQVRVY